MFLFSYLSLFFVSLYHFPSLSFAAALYRSTTLHDVSEDEFEHATPVMVLTPARRESGKKQVKRRFRRRKETGDNVEHSEKQRKGKDCKLYPMVANSRCNALHKETSDSSSSDESQWAQARRRAREKVKMPRKGRRSNRSCNNPDGSPNNNAIELVTLGTMGKKKQEVSDSDNHTLSHWRRKVSRCKESCLSLSSVSSREAGSSSRKCGKNRGKSYPQDLQSSSYLRQNKVVKEGFMERGSGSDAMTVPDNGEPVGAGPSVTDAVQKPPVLYDDWSDDLEVCRLVSHKKDLILPKGIGYCHESYVPFT